MPSRITEFVDSIGPAVTEAIRRQSEQDIKYQITSHVDVDRTLPGQVDLEESHHLEMLQRASSGGAKKIVPSGPKIFGPVRTSVILNAALAADQGQGETSEIFCAASEKSISTAWTILPAEDSLNSGFASAVDSLASQNEKKRKVNLWGQLFKIPVFTKGREVSKQAEKLGLRVGEWDPEKDLTLEALKRRAAEKKKAQRDAAATKIQQHIRMRNFRLGLKRSKAEWNAAATRLQLWWHHSRMKRTVLYLLRVWARNIRSAVKIQAWYRGCQTRWVFQHTIQFFRVQTNLQIFNEMREAVQEEAVGKIIHAFRSHLFRKREKLREAKRFWACLLIQRRIRRWRKEFAERKARRKSHHMKRKEIQNVHRLKVPGFGNSDKFAKKMMTGRRGGMRVGAERDSDHSGEVDHPLLDEAQVGSLEDLVKKAKSSGSPTGSGSDDDSDESDADSEGHEHDVDDKARASAIIDVDAPIMSLSFDPEALVKSSKPENDAGAKRNKPKPGFNKTKTALNLGGAPAFVPPAKFGRLRMARTSLSDEGPAASGTMSSVDQLVGNARRTSMEDLVADGSALAEYLDFLGMYENSMQARDDARSCGLPPIMLYGIYLDPKRLRRLLIEEQKAIKKAGGWHPAMAFEDFEVEDLNADEDEDEEGTDSQAVDSQELTGVDSSLDMGALGGNLPARRSYIEMPPNSGESRRGSNIDGGSKRASHVDTSQTVGNVAQHIPAINVMQTLQAQLTNTAKQTKGSSGKRASTADPMSAPNSNRSSFAGGSRGSAVMDPSEHLASLLGGKGNSPSPIQDSGPPRASKLGPSLGPSFGPKQPPSFGPKEGHGANFAFNNQFKKAAAPSLLGHIAQGRNQGTNERFSLFQLTQMNISGPGHQRSGSTMGNPLGNFGPPTIRASNAFQQRDSNAFQSNFGPASGPGLLAPSGRNMGGRANSFNGPRDSLSHGGNPVMLQPGHGGARASIQQRSHSHLVPGGGRRESHARQNSVMDLRKGSNVGGAQDFGRESSIGTQSNTGQRSSQGRAAASFNPNSGSSRHGPLFPPPLQPHAQQAVQQSATPAPSASKLQGGRAMSGILQPDKRGSFSTLELPGQQSSRGSFSSQQPERKLSAFVKSGTSAVTAKINSLLPGGNVILPGELDAHGNIQQPDFGRRASSMHHGSGRRESGLVPTRSDSVIHGPPGMGPPGMGAMRKGSAMMGADRRNSAMQGQGPLGSDRRNSAMQGLQHMLASPMGKDDRRGSALMPPGGEAMTHQRRDSALVGQRRDSNLANAISVGNVMGMPPRQRQGSNIGAGLLVTTGQPDPGRRGGSFLGGGALLLPNSQGGGAPAVPQLRHSMINMQGPGNDLLGSNPNSRSPSPRAPSNSPRPPTLQPNMPANKPGILSMSRKSAITEETDSDCLSSKMTSSIHEPGVASSESDGSSVGMSSHLSAPKSENFNVYLAGGKVAPRQSLLKGGALKHAREKLQDTFGKSDSEGHQQSMGTGTGTAGRWGKIKSLMGTDTNKEKNDKPKASILRTVMSKQKSENKNKDGSESSRGLMKRDDIRPSYVQGGNHLLVSKTAEQRKASYQPSVFFDAHAELEEEEVGINNEETLAAIEERKLAIDSKGKIALGVASLKLTGERSRNTQGELPPDEETASKSLSLKLLDTSGGANISQDVARLVRGTTLFQMLPSGKTSALIEAMTINWFGNGSAIINQGDTQSAFHLVDDGSCNVMHHAGLMKSSSKIGRLDKGSFFGECALMGEEKAHVSVVAAKEGCSTLSIDRATFEELGIKRAILKELVGRLPLFTALRHRFAGRIADLLTIKYWDHNQQVGKEGESIDGVVIFLQGATQSIDTIAHSAFIQGDWIGERALLSDNHKWPYDVLASGDSLVTVHLSRKDFRESGIKDSFFEDLVRSVPLFRQLADDDVQNVVAATEVSTWEEGAELLKCGEYGSFLMILLEGSANVQNDVGAEVLTLEPGKFFGEKALLCGERWRVSVIAQSGGATTLVLPGGLFRGLGLKQRVCQTFLQMVPLFTKCSEQQLTELAEEIKATRWEAGEIIVKQGEEGSDFYLIQSGQATVSVDFGEGDVQVALLEPGDYLGEKALLTGERRRATVRADRGGLVALHMGKEEFEKLDLKARVVEFWIAAVPSFMDLTEEQMGQIARIMVPRTFDPGEVVIRQGEMGHEMYVIQGNTAEVHVKGEDDEERQVATLEQGDFFGEKALLTGESRKATVVAGDKGLQCLAIGSEAFNKLGLAEIVAETWRTTLMNPTIAEEKEEEKAPAAPKQRPSCLRKPIAQPPPIHTISEDGEHAEEDGTGSTIASLPSSKFHTQHRRRQGRVSIDPMQFSVTHH